MRILTRIATSKAVIVSAALVCLYGLAGFVLAPYLLERYVPRYVATELGSRATIGDLSVNPFLLTLDARDLRLDQENGGRIAAARRLLIDFDLSSLFRWAWTFGDVRLEGLDLSVDVESDGRLNIAAIADRVMSRRPPTGHTQPQRVLLRHFAVTESRFTFNDRSGDSPASTTVAPVNMEVMDLATLPDRPGHYAIAAALPSGGSMSWRGEVSLLPIRSTGEISIRGLQLAAAWPFLRNVRHTSAPNGVLDLGTRYRFAYEAGKVRFALEGVRGQVSGLALKASAAAEPLLAVETITATDGRFDYANRELRFEAALRIAPEGTVEASGTVARDFSSASAQVKMARVALTPLQPLLAHYAALDLKAGEMATSFKLDYGASKTPARLQATGGIALSNVLLNEPETGDPLASWKALSADDVTFTLDPARLQVKDVLVTEPSAKVIISRTRKLNLAEVLKRDAAAAKDADTSAPFAWNIDRIRVRSGSVAFADCSLALPFSTRVRRFNGAMVGLSNNHARRADLKLDGRIQQSGAATVAGSVNVADPKSFTDIRVKFDNVAVPTLTPYTVTFAGYNVASGRLWLDLNYKIVHGKLVGENKIALEHFTLGEHMAAPTALDLPIELAVAILKDEAGRINLAVPVSGDVNRPDFDYGVVIREAIKSWITRVVTAPFRALGALFHGTDAPDGSVEFPPGSARLAGSEREKLDKIAQALRSRAELKVVVHGPYDPQRDAEALREERARRALARALGMKLEEREDPGPIAFSDAATQRALEELLEARAGRDAVREFAAEFQRRAGRAPNRANRLLARFGRASEDREFYEALFRRTVELEPLSDGDLQALAARRAQVIADYLVQAAGVEASRVALAEAHPARRSSDHAVTAELALDVVRRAS